MAVSDEPGEEWESQAEVDACLEETGVSKTRLAWWRHKGLFGRLDQIKQVQTAYRGSFVLYPRGTCAQIRAIKALFQEKDRVKYVGLRLWRRGLPVDEKYWRPRLISAGLLVDRAQWILSWLIRRFDRPGSIETFQERAARQPVKNIILSRITGRLNVDDLAIVIRVLADIGTGQFQDFEFQAQEKEPMDECVTIAALDISASEHHEILGHKLRLKRALLFGLSNAATALRVGNFEEAAKMPSEEVAKARDDALNTLRIAVAQYRCMAWVYGEEAFGLRFACWIGERAPDAVINGLILIVLRLRSIPGAILPSEELAFLAAQAEKAREISSQAERLWRENPAFKDVLAPKRIRAAFKDKISLKRWIEDVRLAAAWQSDADRGGSSGRGPRNDQGYKA